MSHTPSDPIILSRDCDIIMIPSGTRSVLTQGTEVAITQSLGGTYTIMHPSGLARVDGKDADALGQEVVASEKNILPGAVAVVDESAVRNQLRMVFDPEIPVNIVDLGLVYAISITQLAESSYSVKVSMTLTAPGCGMGPAIAADAKNRVQSLEGVTDADVEIVWEPPWNQEMVSEVGKMQLGWV